MREGLPQRERKNGGDDGDDAAGDGDAGNDPDESQRMGLDRAVFRERVRRAGRRIIAFGPLTGELEQGEVCGDRVFECVQNGKSVEPSFAKGEWALRVQS